MNTLLKISSGYCPTGDTFKMVFTKRITSALDMLELIQKVHVEQETSTPYSDFCDAVGKFASEKGLFLNMKEEYFRGISDVIFEYTFDIFPEKKENKVDVNSIKIMGTFFKEIVNYFEWNKYRNVEIINSYDASLYEYLLEIN